MRAILNIPLALARLLWRFINPGRTAGRIPLGRLAIVVQLIAALIFVGYTLNKKAIRLPFSSGPFEVQVLFSDAQGLDRLDEPAAAVAGTPLGRVTKVEFDESGRALATLSFEPEVRGKVFADASAAIRPASALQNLLVNVDPGTPSKGPLPEGKPIPPERTTGNVTIDELTSVLDADTQAYIQILVGEAKTALQGREGELRAALAELGELTETATPLSEALAERRELLTKLVGELEVVFTTLGERGDQLAEGIETASRTLEVTAAREPELARATRELAPLLLEAERSLAALRGVARPLVPALDELIPASGPLADGVRKLRALLPRAESLTDRFEELVRDGAEPLRLLLRATDDLPRRAREMVPVARDLTRVARLMDAFKEGAPQTADTLSGALSAQDTGGGYGQVANLKFEGLRPENFGREGSASARDRRRLELQVARALERTCRSENALACLLRFQVPGLPELPLEGAGRSR